MIHVSGSGDHDNYSNNPSSEDYSGIVQRTSFLSAADVVRCSAPRMIALFRCAELEAQTFVCTGLCVLAFCHVNVRGPMSASCCSIQYLRESC
jgi:hypothetical protein